jgi:hypothetical protein
MTVLADEVLKVILAAAAACAGARLVPYRFDRCRALACYGNHLFVSHGVADTRKHDPASSFR